MTNETLGTCEQFSDWLHRSGSACVNFKPFRDPADDGPEVKLIRFFKYFPEGSRYAPVLHLLKSRAPLAS